jgi:hypothetical protein
MTDNVVVLKWIILSGIGLLVLVVILAFTLRGRVVTVGGGSGFVAFGSGDDDKVHHTDKVGLTKVMDRLLKGDIYDLVWVSGVNDPYEGLTLTLESGQPTLDVGFNTASQQAEVKAFRDGLARFKYKLVEDSDSFNGGMTEAHRQTNMQYTLPRDPEQMVAFVEAALAQLHGSRPDGFYLTGSLLADGPGSGSGVTITTPKDPLSQVLG